MNTTKHGMRTVLAATAAGALVLGSAAGVATAKPAKGKPSSQGVVKLRMVDVHNGFVNVAANATARDVKLKANVWDTSKDLTPVVKITLTQLSGKGGTVTNPAFSKVVDLASTGKAGKKSQNFRGVLLGSEIKTAFATLPAGQTAWVCLTDATAGAGTSARQVTKKIERKRDCFRVVNVDPTTTKSTSDDLKS